MKVCFRVDASILIGTGHLMRCLTLAHNLREKGAEVSFIMRHLPQKLYNLVIDNGCRLFLLPGVELPVGEIYDRYQNWLGVSWRTDVNQTKDVLIKQGNCDWLIIDHYSLDAYWESEIRTYTNRIMVIDDLANRPHDCDLLLDQNFYMNMEARYKGLVPANCNKLLGPQYALLRHEIIEARKIIKNRDGTVNRILIFFGGSDPTNETLKALMAIRRINRPDISVTVVVGGANPNSEQIRERCSLFPNVTFLCQVSNMGELMANSDLAIGAGGATMWERCYLGLPSLIMVLAENQSETVTAVDSAGAVLSLGFANNVDDKILATAIIKAIQSRDLLKKMGKRAMGIMKSNINGNAVLKAIMGDSYAKA